MTGSRKETAFQVNGGFSKGEAVHAVASSTHSIIRHSLNIYNILAGIKLKGRKKKKKNKMKIIIVRKVCWYVWQLKV